MLLHARIAPRPARVKFLLRVPPRRVCTAIRAAIRAAPPGTGVVRAALVFLESYRELPLLAWPREVLAALLEVEQGFVIFRQRHARMVERVIGRRTGTGGSAGVEYLDKTAVEYRIFKDIWAVRTVLLPVEDVPPLRDPAFYGFGALD